MKPRILILPIAAAMILALVVYRLRREERRPSSLPPVAQRRLAPDIVLSNQSRQLVKLNAYLGRTRIVLVFFDSTVGADADPVLAPLVEHCSRLESDGIQVIAVSTATRYENQQAEERLGREFPFPLLTDIDLTGAVPAPAHQTWGLFNADRNETQTGLFLIDRDGTVRWEGGRPKPVDDSQTAIEELISGSWPTAD